jgi:hypothetical protein
MNTWLQFDIRYDFKVSKFDPDSLRTKHAYIIVGFLFQRYSVRGVGMYVEFIPAKYSALSSHLSSRNLCTD